MRLSARVALAMVAAGPAAADERDYCPERPGLGTPPCTMAPGRLSLEVGLADWTSDDDGSGRTDTLLLADTLVRIGLNETVEAQFGWSPFGRERTRDPGTGKVERIGRVGDVTLALKANLRNPDGTGLSLALQPFLSLPVGREPIGAGDWAAGLVVPLSYELDRSLTVQLTPEIGAIVDGDGNGRHLAYSLVVGLGVAISDAIGAAVEFAATRDDDPAGATSPLLAAVSLAWTPDAALQFDIGTSVGLDAPAPDVRVSLGVACRF